MQEVNFSGKKFVRKRLPDYSKRHLFMNVIFYFTCVLGKKKVGLLNKSNLS